MAPDNELLARWLRTRSEQDFAELVQRHLAMVHSAALRVVNGDRHLADDVAQTVFADLARKARSLTDRPSLAGWLHTSARFAAMGLLRGEHRRRQREQEALSMPQDPAASDAPAWSELQPVIDAAISDLSAKDREALLLRYFENRSHREIGELLGLTDNAARMRVERALDKACSLLAKRGITSSTSGLAAALLAHGTLATSAVTAAQITATATALTTTAAAGSGFTLLHLMTATQLKTGLAVTVVVAGLSVPLVLENRANAELRNQNTSLNAQLARIPLLETENARLRGETVDRAELEALRAEQDEFRRLRIEAAMRRKTVEDSELSASSTSSTKPETSENLMSIVEEQERRKVAILMEIPHIRTPIRKAVSDRIVLKRAQDMKINQDLDEELADKRIAELDDLITMWCTKHLHLAQELGRLNNEVLPIESNAFLEAFPATSTATGKAPSGTPLFREQYPTRDADGQFRRLYWFADGHSEEVSQSSNDFSAWEKAHGAP